MGHRARTGAVICLTSVAVKVGSCPKRLSREHEGGLNCDSFIHGTAQIGHCEARRNTWLQSVSGRGSTSEVGRMSSEKQPRRASTLTDGSRKWRRCTTQERTVDQINASSGGHPRTATREESQSRITRRTQSKREEEVWV